MSLAVVACFGALAAGMTPFTQERPSVDPAAASGAGMNRSPDFAGENQILWSSEPATGQVLARDLEVFRRPPKLQSLPADVSRVLLELADDPFDLSGVVPIGRVDADSGQRLLSAQGLSLYGAITSGGAVCYVLRAEDSADDAIAAAGCVTGLDRGITVDTVAIGGGQTAAWGLLADGVQDVRLQARSGLLVPVVGTNAFLYRGTTSEISKLTAARVVWVDRETTVALGSK